MPSRSTIAKVTVLRYTPGLWEGGAGRDSIVWIFPPADPKKFGDENTRQLLLF